MNQAASCAATAKTSASPTDPTARPRKSSEATTRSPPQTTKRRSIAAATARPCISEGPWKCVRSTSILADTHQLVDHLFRQQAGQMVAWLTRVFGPAHLELAEEVVQDALLKALQQWPFSGVLPTRPR